ncbi:MAG: hypothetical protein Q7S31_03740 [bacterium]|nr:hypothetical protein [bacterium]
MPKIAITMTGGPQGKESRLARILTQTVQAHPEWLALDFRDQDTLALALPELIRQCKAQVEAAISEENNAMTVTPTDLK